MLCATVSSQWHLVQLTTSLGTLCLCDFSVQLDSYLVLRGANIKEGKATHAPYHTIFANIDCFH